jgi:hypothetical protein
MKPETFKKHLLSLCPENNWGLLANRYWEGLERNWGEFEFRNKWFTFLKFQLASELYTREEDSRVGERKSAEFKKRVDKLWKSC